MQRIRTSSAMLAPFKLTRGVPVTPHLPLADRKTGINLRRRRNSTITSASSNAITQRFVKTFDGACDLEVLEAKSSSSSSSKPPLLFVHGSGHAAWCWAENFMQHAAARGFDSAAVSLRGRGGSGPPPKGAKAGGTLESHAEDVAAVAEALVGEGSRPPIIVGHSFGGMVVETLSLREREKEKKRRTGEAGAGSSSSDSDSASASASASLLSGIAFLNSVPPSGNASMIGRIAKQRGLWVSAKLTYGFITRAYAKDPALCRLMFFSEELADAEVERFVRLLRENDGETPVLDVRELPKQVPLPPLLLEEDRESSSAPPLWPAFVLGGREDTIVDEQACLEIAEWAGIPTASKGDNQKASQQLVMIEGLAHDCMLDARWREAADSLLSWAEGV